MKRNANRKPRKPASRHQTPIVLETTCGDNIETVCKTALKMAIRQKKPVKFNLNGKTVTANPTDSWRAVLKKWNKDYDPAKASVYPKDATEALRRWDDGQGVFTIEMGGLGPGYEQAIQILVFEILSEHLNGKTPLPKPGQSSNGWMDNVVSKIDKDCGGFSGAQVGAAKNLAYHYLNQGYEKVIKQFKSDRTIQVSKFFPSLSPPASSAAQLGDNK